MKITIDIVGQIDDEKKIPDIQKTIEKLLHDNFKSFRYNWELVRGLQK
jgi:hypothetical protein